MKRIKSSLESLQYDISSFYMMDRDSIKYYAQEFKQLSDLSTVTITVTDFEGNKTKDLNLNPESLLCLLDLLIKMEDK